MGREGRRVAVVHADAGVDYRQVRQAYVGYVYGDSTCGQAALYGLGQSGIPIVNVNNNCSTGSTTLYLARQAVESGAAECVLALGFEQMQRGALTIQWPDRPSPFERFDKVAHAVQGISDAPFAAQYFGGAGAAYAQQYGTGPETFAAIAVKARRHAANNPYAVFRDPVTTEDVLNSPHIFGPLTRLQCCPPTCGAAAAVITTEEFARKHGLRTDVSIAAQAMTTDTPSTFDEADMRKLVGYDMSKEAARQVYEAAGAGPEDIPVVELHDCFTTNELLTYEALGLTPEGTAEKFVADGDNTYGGRVVTNPSGGLLSKGHPLGATGLVDVVLDTDLPTSFTTATPSPGTTGTLMPASRREALLAQAARMFAEHGYTGVGIEDIGSAVGITGPSVYNHFPSKLDMLTTLIARGAATLQTELSAAYLAAAGAPDALRRLVRSYLRFVCAHPHLIDLLITETGNLPPAERHQARQVQHDYLTEWVHLSRLVDPGLDPAVARIRVHAVLSIANDAARMPRLHDNPALPAALEILADRLLEAPL
ncbi:hypothetical protein DMP23_12550 [Amycolatopsis sp. A1MSW2902]|uniref:thiolase C-terminal domain-containing protein n=1 Tax=Amycolatopsis sp. A1MSW2902 TaxID=687413 RepID=UPI00307D5288